MAKVKHKIDPRSRNGSKIKQPESIKSEKLKGRISLKDMRCDVCGDKVKAQNYGGISCNCCRSFFHYYVINKVEDPTSIQHLKRNCKFENDCVIDKVTRKKCKTCRFFKCVTIGMSPAWVWKEYEKARELKQQRMQTNVFFKKKNKLLSDDDTKKITNLSKFYQTACELIPYTFLTREENEVLTYTKIHLIDIGRLSTAIRRFVCFARMLPEFARLGLHDQANLLRRSVVEMLLLRDVIRKYPYESRKVGLDRGKFPELPVLTEDEFISVIPKHVMEMYYTLYKRIRSIAPDEESIMLLIPIALFSDSGGNENCTDFDDRLAINSAQELYTALLEKYLKSTQGRARGRVLFPRLLSQLSAVTEASHLHQGLPLNMSDDQVDKMHKHLHQLQLKTCEQPVNKYNQDHSNGKPTEQIGEQRECCKKSVPLKKPVSKTDSSKWEVPTTPEPASETLPALIHTFVSISNEFGIKQDYFESGPHVGVEKAFMRRMPQLLKNPWDSLVNEVDKLVISDCGTLEK
ncbi:thyroid hormone receptor beta [Folsomia candida]|uniref:Thyroid hormone receptor beta n=1 Tax=Folsomia candida TaxID=158441 RepID=A0A226EXB3_FOLCA|nr:thyroid hormone receptor beta [Folsomia candida]XP_035702645.1 thyroid hormone receptor beta [Folsomia candida]OXA62243.1 Thyroid hormone receptor beta [Folsomia candida]